MIATGGKRDPIGLKLGTVSSYGHMILGYKYSS